MRRDIQNILDEVVNRIVHRFDPQRIILFGSYAIGEPNANSDLDLLIVMDVEGSARQTAIEIDMLVSDRRIPMDWEPVEEKEAKSAFEVVSSMRSAIRNFLIPLTPMK